MNDVWGYFLGPPHSTTPAAVIANKNKTDPLRAVSIFVRKVMGHTAVSAIQASSVTLKIWQHGAKENCCNFTTERDLSNKSNPQMRTKDYKKVMMMI